MIRKVKTVEKLDRLLHKLNNKGIDPCVAVLDSRGIVALAYGIDQADMMGTVSLMSPGDDRTRGESFTGEGNYIDPFEQPLEALCPPFTVMYPEPPEGDKR